ncbi:LPS export ABC transporter permease LptG [Lichenicoccus roseus]|uniref:LPS export ABC transporter permease LptG n=1 Tax=Lichenicoccus roseus TaxID=2683649 RepID=A0A5R9J5F0_9PROT|nr:LPS export ABC transporter permease LptG [Lichenicoccus roseus]TLU71737.1 LPS export ABC transporter permease LptG [Lichenicoccus roseus]
MLRRYVSLATLKAFALAAAALTGLLSLLELVEQLASVGQGRYRLADAFVYVLLTAPGRFLQVTPMAMLLGALLALGALARNSELVAMLGLGISARRIVGSVLLPIVPIVVLLLALAEFVIPPAQRYAQDDRAAALDAASSASGDNSLWAQNNRQYLNIQRFRNDRTPVGIDIYRFAPDGRLISIVHADHATIRPDGEWLLADVSRKINTAADLTTEHLATLSWHAFVTPREMQVLTLPLTSIPPTALYRQVHSLEARNEGASHYEHQLWERICLPVTLAAMVMIASAFMFGAGRTQSTGRSLLFGAGFGIVFSLGQLIFSRLGVLLDLDAAVTALTPALLTIWLSLYLFRTASR